MKRSTDRILTTHTGSLPRPMDLAAMLEGLESGKTPNAESFETRVREAVPRRYRTRWSPGWTLSATASKAR